MIIIFCLYSTTLSAALLGIAFTLLLSLTQSSIHLNSPGSIKRVLLALLKQIAITSCQLLISGQVNRSLQDSIAAPEPRTRDPSVTCPVL